MYIMYCIAQNGGGKTVNLEQFAKVLPIKIYIIKLQVDSTTNEYRVNSGEHAWLKLVTDKSIQSPLQPMPVFLEIPSSLSQGSYAPSLGAFQIKHLYTCVIRSIILSPHLIDTAKAHHSSTTHDDKINDCGFKISVACVMQVECFN